MKKIISTFLSLLLFITASYAQAVSKQNVVAYNNQEECKSDILLQELMANDPSYAMKIANYNKLVQQGNNLNKGTVYNIPVVVHVIHLGEAEGSGTNISDAQIHSAINNLNQAYRNQAPYTGVDMEINFCLASVNPSGNPTSGINRVNGSGTSDYATQGITNDVGSSLNEVAVKALSNWGNTNYYQFWIVAGIDGNMGGGGTQGYAYFSQSSSKDGAVILYNSFGYDPTGTLCYNLKSYTNQNVTTTHEVGHAFGLYHTFQGDGTGSDCPTNNDCSTDGDLVCDTPPHKRSTSNCVVATNTCTGGSSSDHIHNFMDYSSDDCQTEFTANQVTRARAWLLSSRLSLTTSTKCNPVAVAVSNFEAVCGSQSGCGGSSIDFFDLSEGNPTAWSWSFPGGSPATSTAQYPTVSYATPGTYAVSLTATNSFGTGNTETKNGFITIYSTPTVACTTGSQNSGNFWQTLYNVTFNEINNSTSQYVNTAYTDFSCSQTTVVNAGDSYQMSISINAEGGSGNEVFEAYIDYNNNGSFADVGEMVFSGSVASGNLGTLNQNIAIPLTATTNTLLRMRVIGETNTISANERNCVSSFFIGDVEDYGVYIVAAGTPPVADFSGTPTTLCAGSSVNFSDLSTNTPTGWVWTFTGGTPSSSTSQNPTVTYNAPGVYQVALTATNASGSDGETKVGYITVNAVNNASIASSTPTLCVNTLLTNITHTTTGATGIGVASGLPTGVTANWNSNTITISGTPTASGTFNYTIPLTGGCGTVNATGTITVNAAPSISSQPSNSIITEGNNTSFSVTASNTIGYQWQVNTGSGFGNISNGGVYSNTTTATLNITGATLTMNGYTYRCVATGNCSPTATSNSASLTVNAAPIIPTTYLRPQYEKTFLAYSEKLACFPVANAQEYEWEFTPSGGGSAIIYNWGINNPSLLLGWAGLSDGITYNVRVRAKVGGVFGSYGLTKQLTTPGNTSLTSIVSTYCGKNYSSYAEQLNCYPVTNATEYEFEFNPTGGGAIVNYVQTSNSILLSWTTGLLDNTTYNVRVRAKVGGTFGSYGNSCQITTPSSSNTTSLKTSYCGVTYTSMSAKLACYSVLDAEDYEWEFTPVGGGTVLLDTTISTSPSILINFIPGIQEGVSYDVRIRPRLSGVYGSFGSSCEITTPSGAMIVQETARLAYYGEEESVIENPTTLSIYPNPNTGEQLNVNLENLSPNTTLTISDIYGKIVMTKPLNTDQSEYRVNVKFENKLSAGFYLVSISSEGNTITEKLIVR